MYTVTKYPHGTFSWADCVSTDVEKAKPFYMELFGWDKIEVPMGDDATYTMFQLQGRHVAALAPMPADVRAMGIPSHWNNYVTVDDVDALASLVAEHGGSIQYGPLDVFDSGRMVQVQDPTGAAVGLWQARNHIGAGVVNTVGAMCWNELNTPDAEAAKTFYAALLGWEYAGDAQYTHIVNRGRANGGLLQMNTGMPPCWMPYFHIADIDAGSARVNELGGKVVVPRRTLPDGSIWAVVADPAGAHFYIIQLSKADTWIE